MLLRAPLLSSLLVLLGTLACTPTDTGENSATACEPRTCAELGLQCGQAADGCGGLLACGTCAPGAQCSAGTCQAGCSPRTCAQVGARCGSVPDGCGGTLACGECAAGETCGGGGPGLCGPSTCVPTTCAALAKDCGLVSDGCGKVLDCGGCPEGSACGAGGVANVCAARACTPRTCASAGADCGTLPDGCGGTLSCGTCGKGRTCGGGGLSNVCTAPWAPPAREWVRTLPDPLTALATDAAGNALLLLRTPTGTGPAKLDAEGTVLWTRPGTSGLLSLSGLTVAPGTGELLAWGWQDGASGPGGAVLVRFTATGEPATGGQRCNDACSLGPASADAAGDVLLLQLGAQGSTLSCTRPGGNGWQLTHAAAQPAPEDVLDWGPAHFDARGSALVAATTVGEGTRWGRSFGAPGESHPVVLELTREGRFVWSRELDATRGRMRELGVARDGTVVGLGEFGGALRWEGEVLTTPQPSELQTVLFALDAGGYPKWLRALPLPAPLLAVSPSGHIAVADTVSSPGDAGCTGVRLAEYGPLGQLLWADTLLPRGCTGSLGLRGLAYAGEQVVVGGTLRGTVDLGTEVWQADADGLSGFVLKLQAGH